MTNHNRLFFDRQIRLSEIGRQGQDAIRNACILIIGAGGLGSQVVEHLVRAGVGRLILIDDDVISESNLPRQHQFTTQTVGEPKAQVLSSRLRGFYGDFPEIEVIQRRWDAKWPENFDFGALTLVMDCTDNFATRYMIADYCNAAGLPYISAAIEEFQGQVARYNAPAEDGSKGGTLQCLFPQPPVSAASCDTVGVLGPAVGVMASLMAQDALLFICGKPGLHNTLLRIDLLKFTTQRFEFERHPDAEATSMAHSEVGPDSPLEVINLDLAPGEADYIDVQYLITEWEPTHTALHIECKTGKRAAIVCRRLQAKFPHINFTFGQTAE